MKKNIDVYSAHVRIGWEPSPENFDWVRYHIVSVDYNRIGAEAKIKKFIEELAKNGPISTIRIPRKGKIQGCNLEYIFQTFDSPSPMSLINKRKLGRNIIEDYKFCERIVGNIERYVENLFD